MDGKAVLGIVESDGFAPFIYIYLFIYFFLKKCWHLLMAFIYSLHIYMFFNDITSFHYNAHIYSLHLALCLQMLNSALKG